MALEDRRENVALQRVNAEEKHESAGRGDPPGRKAREHHDQPADQRADRRNEAKQSGLDAQNEGTLDADDREANPGYEKNREHGDDLRNQPALQRFADAVDNHGRGCAVPNWRHEQQPRSVDARLGCERQSEEQYNKEVAALTVPRSNFRVWLTIAPPLEAIAPALGRLCVVGAPDIAGVDESVGGAAALPRSK